MKYGDRMRLISWNVNSIRRRNETGRLDEIFDLKPDIFCVQEFKVNPKNLDSKIIHKKGYHSYFYPPSNPELNGYSGVATYTKYPPITLKHGFNNKFDVEGRIQTIEFEEFNLYNVYFPSAGDDKFEEKCEFFELFTEYVCESEKPQIICGDFNRGASEKDIYEYKPTTNGFKPEEIQWFKSFMESGFVDSFRLKNKDYDHYTWWHSGDKNREKNEGFRLDYFLVSEELKDNITDASILYDIYDGDHVPITLELEF